MVSLFQERLTSKGPAGAGKPERYSSGDRTEAAPLGKMARLLPALVLIQVLGCPGF